MAHNILFSYETQPHNATLLALYFIVALNILEFFGTLLALYSLVASNILEFFFNLYFMCLWHIKSCLLVRYILIMRHYWRFMSLWHLLFLGALVMTFFIN